MTLFDTIPDLKPIILRFAPEYWISLDDAQLDSFQKYYELILQESENQNLVSKNDLARFAEYHLLDALKIASCFDFGSVKSLLDFGSGAGLPGIPLALTFPAIEILLVDSRARRCQFLEAVCSDIPVPNARVACSRIETIPASENSLFDVVITRATLSLAKFYSAGKRFLSPGGALIAIKGDTVDNELKALESAIDTTLFNITCTYPTPVAGVRTGTVIIIKDSKLSTNTAKQH